MTLKTIVQIGGDSCEIDKSNNSTSCYKETREDGKDARIEISKVTGEKTVVKKTSRDAYGREMEAR